MFDAPVLASETVKSLDCVVAVPPGVNVGVGGAVVPASVVTGVAIVYAAVATGESVHVAPIVLEIALNVSAIVT
jgi:hypothetical protein